MWTDDERKQLAELYRNFVEHVINEEDADAEFRPNYQPRGAGRPVPAIVTTLDGVTLGILWAQFCDEQNVHWSDRRAFAPTASDAMGVDRVYHP